VDIDLDYKIRCPLCRGTWCGTCGPWVQGFDDELHTQGFAEKATCHSSCYDSATEWYDATTPKKCGFAFCNACPECFCSEDGTTLKKLQDGLRVEPGGVCPSTTLGVPFWDAYSLSNKYKYDNRLTTQPSREADITVSSATEFYDSEFGYVYWNLTSFYDNIQFVNVDDLSGCDTTVTRKRIYVFLSPSLEAVKTVRDYVDANIMCLDNENVGDREDRTAVAFGCTPSDQKNKFVAISGGLNTDCLKSKTLQVWLLPPAPPPSPPSSPQPPEVPPPPYSPLHPFAEVVDACPVDMPSEVRCADETQHEAAVRCCSNDDDSCISVCVGGSGTMPLTTISGGSWSSATYYEATAECEAQGMRLCDVSELPICCQTGCEYDGNLVWSSSSCTPPSPPSPPPSPPPPPEVITKFVSSSIIENGYVFDNSDDVNPVLYINYNDKILFTHNSGSTFATMKIYKCYDVSCTELDNSTPGGGKNTEFTFTPEPPITVNGQIKTPALGWTTANTTCYRYIYQSTEYATWGGPIVITPYQCTIDYYGNCDSSDKGCCSAKCGTDTICDSYCSPCNPN
jgi:hypothetical protein